MNYKLIDDLLYIHKQFLDNLQNFKSVEIYNLHHISTILSRCLRKQWNILKQLITLKLWTLFISNLINDVYFHYVFGISKKTGLEQTKIVSQIVH